MKKIFLDTSCLIAAFLSKHSKHDRTFSLVSDIVNKKVSGYVSSHSIAEVYSVLTRLPGENRLSSETAAELIDYNLNKNFRIVSLNKEDYLSTVQRVASHNLGGGIIYDALILKAAENSNPDVFFTLNARHFRQIPSVISGTIQDI